MASTGRGWLYAVAAVLLLPALCLASEVQVVGVTPGLCANVVIAGGPPITIEIGETVDGVKVLRVDRRSAVLSINGITRTLPLVTYRGSVGDGVGDSVTLSADESGHFMTSGAVNGESVRFIVDTGATLITLSRAQAQRIGLDYDGGTPTQSMTVNGIVKGWRVSLDSVQVGDTTESDVDAIVVDNDTLPVGLLGMSYLNRFDMQRHGSTLVLRRRR